LPEGEDGSRARSKVTETVDGGVVIEEPSPGVVARAVRFGLAGSEVVSRADTGSWTTGPAATSPAGGEALSGSRRGSRSRRGGERARGRLGAGWAAFEASGGGAEGAAHKGSRSRGTGARTVRSGAGKAKDHGSGRRHPGPVRLPGGAAAPSPRLTARAGVGVG